jgi:5-hydroxyisourate hydrolase-like protein (transthyretin family)
MDTVQTGTGNPNACRGLCECRFLESRQDQNRKDMTARGQAIRVVAALITALPGMLYAAAPGNDAFDSPVFLTGFPVTVVGSNVGASLEAAEPVPSSAAEGSVWFSWTSPLSGMVQMDTVGSDFDTWLAVWTGDSLPTLTLVAENDDFAGLQSGVFVDVTQGVNYRIAVYGYSSSRGRIVLNVKEDVTSRITGTVIGPDGTTPLEGIQATAYQWRDGWWQPVNAGQTDANGDYTIGGLPAGTYRVEFRDVGTGEHAPVVYENAPDLDSGTDIVVPADATVTGIDVSLALGARINGVVTGLDGTTPLQGVAVAVYEWGGSWWRWVNWGQTGADGHYTVGGLVAGTYRVQFQDWSNDEYVSQVYENAPDLEGGRDIIVQTGATVTGIDASLAGRSRITGTVTGPDGTTPLEGIEVSAYQRNVTWLGWREMSWGVTDANGDYAIEGLTAGTYRVGFGDWWNVEFAPEAYNNATDLDQGMDIVVPTGDTVTRIDASLAPGSTITGTVTSSDGTTRLADITVSAYQWGGSLLGWQTVGWGRTDTDGHYTIGGLAAGTYHVEFRDWWSGEYATVVYHNAPDLNGGTAISVPASASVTGIDARLESIEPTDMPVIVGIRRTEVHWEILYVGIVGATYVLQESASLTGGWSDVGSPFICQPGTNAILGEPSGPVLFWRIKSEPQ